MTEKLYYSDSHLFEFSATVVSIDSYNNKTVIVLDKTAFFPEGGGQQCDVGEISGIEVIDVFEKDEIIYHGIKGECNLCVGDKVDCKLDRDIRFARMQAHSGEHIVSGIAHSLFGVDNVGFHMDDLMMTVDFNKPLSKDDIALIENKANLCVFDNVKITANIYDKNELENIEFRSKIDFPGPARIVEIEGIDRCACCAPHVKTTGEIGIIKILSSVSHRGGVRITMICGIAALRDYQDKYRQTLNISALLCAKHSETDIAVERLIEANRELKYKQNEEKSRYINYIASKMISESDFIAEIFEDLGMDELRELANLLKTKCVNAVILFSGNDSTGYSYCIYSEKLDLKSFVKDFNSALNGTGGGRPPIAQGKVNADKSIIENYIKEMKAKAYENA